MKRLVCFKKDNTGITFLTENVTFNLLKRGPQPRLYSSNSPTTPTERGSIVFSNDKYELFLYSLSALNQEYGDERIVNKFLK